MDFAVWIIFAGLTIVAFALIDDIFNFGLLDRFIKWYDHVFDDWGGIMPYITQEERDELDPIIDQLYKLCEALRGRVNYCCTRLAHLWALEKMKKAKTFTKKYKIVNDAYGILCSVASEFYNAVVVPYEKLKREENGPVSQLDASPTGLLPKYLCANGHRFEHLSAYRCPSCGTEAEIVRGDEP